MILGDARRLKRYYRRLAVPLKAIITSPPYLDTQNYGILDQIGFGQTRRKYLDDLQKVFKACWDISHPNAALWLVVGAVRRNGELVQLPEKAQCRIRFCPSPWPLQERTQSRRKGQE